MGGPSGVGQAWQAAGAARGSGGGAACGPAGQRPGSRHKCSSRLHWHPQTAALTQVEGLQHGEAARGPPLCRHGAVERVALEIQELQGGQIGQLGRQVGAAQAAACHGTACRLGHMHARWAASERCGAGSNVEQAARVSEHPLAD